MRRVFPVEETLRHVQTDPPWAGPDAIMRTAFPETVPSSGDMIHIFYIVLALNGAWHHLKVKSGPFYAIGCFNNLFI